jgi:hypothetical protein
MQSDVTHFVTYPCPHCKLELEADDAGWQGWSRCPACDTPSLPPDILLGHPATLRHVRVLGDDGDAFPALGVEAPDHDDAPTASELIGPPPSSTTSSLRLLYLTGLVISLFILLVSFLDDNQIVTGSSATMALVFFLLLLRLPGRRRRNP